MPTLTRPTQQVWTFFGHWDNDRIVVEYALAGAVEDQRTDSGYWEEGLWSDTGTGPTMHAAQAALIAQYESDAD